VIYRQLKSIMGKYPEMLRDASLKVFLSCEALRDVGSTRKRNIVSTQNLKNEWRNFDERERKENCRDRIDAG